MTQDTEVQVVTYYRVRRPPTLPQYLYRRAVAELMKDVKGMTGVGIDPDTHRPSPLSAIKAKQGMRGLKARDLAVLHPDWVKEYRAKHGASDPTAV